MAGFEPEEPEFSDDSEYCQAVTIGRYNQDAELTIFYTPKGVSWDYFQDFSNL